jgi:AcrR family transcriptional regulator
MAKQPATDRTGRPDARVSGRRGAAGPAAERPCPAEDAAEACCRQRRSPQHERGRRRVDAILDAAGAILIEGGVEAFSVDAVAKRSGTSKSSMYHFFPDRDAIVRALAERHAAKLRALQDALPTTAEDWAGLTVEETVDRFMAPFRDYNAEHPDVIPCMRAAAHAGGDAAAREIDAITLQRAERLVGARAPHLTPAERRERAAALFAVKVGVLDTMSRLAPVATPAAMLRELREVLIGYLSRLEHADAARERPRAGGRRGARRATPTA